MFHDYKVAFRSEETLAAAAFACRRFAGHETMAHFNVVDFVEQVLPQILARKKKGPLKFKFFDMREGEKPASVTYNPLTLHVDREVWALAGLGDPMARFIVAHEIGHILLHDHHAQGFSNDPSQRIKFVQQEERAEWQADTFASYFLITRCVLDAFWRPQAIAMACGVPTFLAEGRFEAAEEEKRRSARCARARGYTGDVCTNCGNFTLTANGTASKCDTCGSTSEPP